MKTSRIIAIVGIALSCSLAMSCTKETVYSAYDSTMWAGTYPTLVENNDTGEPEDAKAFISLEFGHGGLEVTVTTSIEGLLSANRIKYEARWYSKDNFTLCETIGGQTIQYYSGTIKGDKMSFEFLSCDKVERSIELERVYL